MQLDEKNISVFLKFSIQFDVVELLNLCAVWMESNKLYDQSELILNETNRVERMHLANKIEFNPDQNPTKCNIYPISREHASSDDFIEFNDFLTNSPIQEVNPLNKPSLNDIESPLLATKAKTLSQESDRPVGRLSAELYTLASQSMTYSKECTPDIDNAGESSYCRTQKETSGQILLPKNENNYDTVKKNPVIIYRPNLADWKEFSGNEMLQLCSDLSDYPDFTKVEVAIFWIAEHTKVESLHNVQCLFDRMLKNIDPLSLSDRFIGVLDYYLGSWKERIHFPAHFVSHIGNPFTPDDPASKSKFNMHIWNLSYEDDLEEIQNDDRLSFFSKCMLCDKGNQETVLKLSSCLPSYKVIVKESHRRRTKKYGVEYPVHFHKNTVFHWLIKYGIKKNHKVLSLILNDSKTVKNVLKHEENLKVICLQLKTIKSK